MISDECVESSVRQKRLLAALVAEWSEDTKSMLFDVMVPILLVWIDDTELSCTTKGFLLLLSAKGLDLSGVLVGVLRYGGSPHAVTSSSSFKHSRIEESLPTVTATSYVTLGAGDIQECTNENV